MTIPFDALQPQEVLTFLPGETKFVRFSSVAYNPRLTGTREDGFVINQPGLVFGVISTYPSSRAVSWRLWNKRSIQLFRPLVETDIYRQRWIKITRTGEGFTSDYVPVVMPEGYVPIPDDLKMGPI